MMTVSRPRHSRAFGAVVRGVAVGAVACAFASASAFAAGAATRGGASDAAVRMTVVGDSLAVGTGASDPANAFAFRIYRTLLARHPGSEVTNHAIGGSRVADVTRLQVPEIASDSDLVFVVVGGNDVVRQTGLARFARDADGLVRAIRRRVPRAAVVVCGVPDVARSPLFADSRAKTERLSRSDDAAMRAAASRNGATFVDLFALTRARGADAEFLSADDFHPSDAGYALLAGLAAPVVEGALSQRPLHGPANRSTGRYNGS